MMSFNLGHRWSYNNGVTLLEVIIASAIASVILLIALLMCRSAIGLYATESINGAAELTVERTLNQIVNEVIDLKPTLIEELLASMTAPASSPTLTFRHANYDPLLNASTYGPLTRITVENGQVALISDLGGANSSSRNLAGPVPALAGGETANGLDDNGNGLVDEAGLSFVMASASTLKITLALEFRNERGVVEVFTGTATVQLRNQ
jgi:prepilin-type N-terminal cleavage/methylation domain-containing protein